MTTCRRNFWFWNGPGRGLGLLAVRSFCLGMLGFDLVGLATFGLPTRLQPAVDLPLAFRILAVTLVPTPWLVLATAPLAQAFPPGAGGVLWRHAVLSRTLTGAHGRFDLPRESSGRMCQHSPRRDQNANKTIACKSTVFSGNKTENKTALDAPGNKTIGSRATISGSLQTIKNGSEFLIGVSLCWILQASVEAPITDLSERFHHGAPVADRPPSSRSTVLRRACSPRSCRRRSFGTRQAPALIDQANKWIEEKTQEDIGFKVTILGVDIDVTCKQTHQNR